MPARRHTTGFRPTHCQSRSTGRRALLTSQVRRLPRAREVASSWLQTLPGSAILRPEAWQGLLFAAANRRGALAWEEPTESAHIPVSLGQQSVEEKSVA